MKIGLTRKPGMSTVLIIDEVQDPWGADRAAYWRASVPTTDMVKLNPRNYGMYKRSRANDRIVAWIGLPLIITIIVSARIFLTYSSPAVLQAFTIAVMGGIAAGVFIGVPLAKVVTGTALKMEYLYVFGRVPKDKLHIFGLEVEGGAGFALIAINPPPLLTGETDDSSTLVAETRMTLWRLDALYRGVDGWSTNNFIEVSIAENLRKDNLRRGRRDPPPAINIDRPVDQSIASLPGDH